MENRSYNKKRKCNGCTADIGIHHVCRPQSALNCYYVMQDVQDDENVRKAMNCALKVQSFMSFVLPMGFQMTFKMVSSLSYPSERKEMRQAFLANPVIC